MLGEIVNDRKIKILEQRWTVLRASLQEFLDGPKDLTVRDLVHQLLIGQQSTDVALTAALEARRQYVEAYGEPDGDEPREQMEAFMEKVAIQAADLVLSTPTPDPKEIP